MPCKKIKIKIKKKNLKISAATKLLVLVNSKTVAKFKIFKQLLTTAVSLLKPGTKT